MRLILSFVMILLGVVCASYILYLICDGMARFALILILSIHLFQIRYRILRFDTFDQSIALD